MPFYFYTIVRFTRFRFIGAMFTRHPSRFADHARVTTDYAQVSTYPCESNATATIFAYTSHCIRALKNNFRIKLLSHLSKF
jgi:hypothetical protein